MGCLRGGRGLGMSGVMFNVFAYTLVCIAGVSLGLVILYLFRYYSALLLHAQHSDLVLRSMFLYC